MKFENIQRGPFPGRKTQLSAQAEKPLITFDHHKDGRLMNLAGAVRKLTNLVQDNKRDDLLRSFPFVTMPDDWRSTMAQTALDRAKLKSATADWQLLLTACAVVWADTPDLQKKSRKALRRTFKGIKRNLDRPTLKDMSYINAVKDGVKLNLYQTGQHERIADLFDSSRAVYLNKLAGTTKLFSIFQQAGDDIGISEKRTDERYKSALEKLSHNKKDLQLKYTRVPLSSKNKLRQMLHV